MEGVKLAGIRVRDIVRAEGYLCFVTEKEGSRLHVRGVQGSWSAVVKATQVSEHWSKRAS